MTSLTVFLILSRKFLGVSWTNLSFKLLIEAYLDRHFVAPP